MNFGEAVDQLKKVVPVSGLDNRTLVRQLVDAATGPTTEANGIRISELQAEVLLRLDAAARPDSLEVSPSEVVTIYRANGALAARGEVLRAIAREYAQAETVEKPGVLRALLAVAGAT